MYCMSYMFMISLTSLVQTVWICLCESRSRPQVLSTHNVLLCFHSWSHITLYLFTCCHAHRWYPKGRLYFLDVFLLKRLFICTIVVCIVLMTSLQKQNLYLKVSAENLLSVSFLFFSNNNMH